ncbi:MAG: BadF/BadG/BcrA/BcrD ATPase family protein, partial [Nitrososphaerota archaeon]
LMILSIDVGATKTCAIIYEEKSHRFMSSGISGASNFMSVSEEESLENIKKAIDFALQGADVDLEELDYIILGLAGIEDSAKSTETGNNIVKRILGSRKYRLETMDCWHIA